MVRITPEEVIRRRQLEQQTTDELDGPDRASRNIAGDDGIGPNHVPADFGNHMPSLPFFTSS